MITSLNRSKSERFCDRLFDSSIMDRVNFILQVLNHNGRKQIIRLLEENDSLTVTEIYIKMRLTQSETSTHLSLMRKAGLVKAKREGKYVLYSLDQERVGNITQEILALSGWLDKTAA